MSGRFSKKASGRYNHITRTVELSVALAPELTQFLGARAPQGAVAGNRK